MKKILLILLLLILAGCAPAGVSPESVPSGVDGKSIGMYVYRVYDEEAGVVCYFRSSSGVAMDCMPVSETLLGR